MLNQFAPVLKSEAKGSWYWPQDEISNTFNQFIIQNVQNTSNLDRKEDQNRC